jgi:hypothetical protein
MEYKRKGGFPRFIDVQKWHLNKAKRCISGYRGESKRSFAYIPSIPIGADASTQLEILQENGYKVVPAPV